MGSHLTTAALVIAAAVACTAAGSTPKRLATPMQAIDSLHFDGTDNAYFIVGGDTVHLWHTPGPAPGAPLTEQDFIDVADELGVEPAAIKAVVEIETGRLHRGFDNELRPIINFDLPVFRRMAQKRGIKLSKYTKSHSAVFARPNIARYGSLNAAQHARLAAAMSIDSIAAIDGTFWGMFQIGGFNWRQCGAKSPADFVALMSRSERDQLELFAEFITRSGLLPHLRNKNWSAFARGYNGPAYASRGYHTRLKKAYKKHSAAK